MFHPALHPTKTALRIVFLALPALLLGLLILPARAAFAQEAPPVYLPVIRTSGTAAAAQGLSREQAIQLYNTYFLPHTVVPDGWTGDHAGCRPGGLSADFTDATLKLVNYFRRAAGVTPVTFDAALSARAQQAALMFSVNGAISHDPPAAWKCFTADGADAAGHSNVALFYSDPLEPEAAGVRAQMEDFGATNVTAGHRRWILRASTRVMGMGHVPSDGSATPAGGALWVINPIELDGESISREPFVAWPPPGYVPWQALYLSNSYWYEHKPEEFKLRWTFQLQRAFFSGATISVTHDGAAVPIERVTAVDGFDPATVFVPALDFDQLSDGKEHVLVVRIANVADVYGEVRDFTYTVHVFDVTQP